MLLNRGYMSLVKISYVLYVSEHCAPYKWLRGGVEFMSQIPKSGSGKILRRLLRDEVAKKRGDP